MRISALILFFFLSVPTVHSQPQDQLNHAQSDWTGTTEQKVWGLMNIWSEAKFAFPHFEARPNLDWDEKVQEFIPRVIDAPDMESYYRILMEFAASLEDGHTAVIPPWGYFTPGHDTPPIEIAVIGDKFVVARLAETKEMIAQRIYPGLEILEIGDHVPVQQYFRDQVLRFYSRGASHADKAVLVVYLLSGPQGEKVRLTVKDNDGTVRGVELTRNSDIGDGMPFFYQFLQQSLFAEQIDARFLADDLLYVKVPNFSHPQIASGFLELVESTDMTAVRGMIIDVRQNMGGSNQICNQIIGSLIERQVSSTHWHYPHHVAAYRAWGLEEPEWDVKHESISPREGKRYTGPLVILTGPVTNSTSEDFAIILQQAGRATIVGQRSAGGSGNPLAVPLPGGGVFEVSTFKATYPDGTEYASIGISPDIEIHPTVQDVGGGVDPVLQAGLSFLKQDGS